MRQELILVLVKMLMKNKKAQVSIEIMYSVGVLLIIFLLLTVMTFNKKIDVEQTRDIIDKKNDCNRISSAINRVLALGDGYNATFRTPHTFDVYTTELIIVGDAETTNSEVEVVCTFEGELTEDYLLGTGKWKAINEKGVLRLEEDI